VAFTGYLHTVAKYKSMLLWPPDTRPRLQIESLLYEYSTSSLRARWLFVAEPVPGTWYDTVPGMTYRTRDTSSIFLKCNDRTL
jgi:hypothetical protein